MWDSSKNRYLKISEILSTTLGTIQNIQDFPETIQIHSNDPEEIRAITSEMISRLNNEYVKDNDYEFLNSKFKNIMHSFGNFMNCDVSIFWINKYHFLID